MPGEMTEYGIREWFFGMFGRRFSQGEMAEFANLWRANEMGRLDPEGLDAMYDTGGFDILKEGKLTRFKDTTELWTHMFTSANGAVRSGSPDSWDGGSISESHESSSDDDEEAEEEGCEYNIDQDESFIQFERDFGRARS